MGFDLHGTDGSYFRENVWGWRPLWQLCCEVGGDVLSRHDKNAGHFNDGHKISAEKSLEIGRRLHDGMKSGWVLKRIEDDATYRAAIPQIDCQYCDADGRRRDLPHSPTEGTLCNACKGTRKCDHSDTWYTLRGESVRELTEFMLGKDGKGNEFGIW